MAAYFSMAILYAPFLLFLTGITIMIVRVFSRREVLKHYALSRKNVYEIFILLLRWYLAYYMFDYGFSKMTGGQFGIQDPAIIEKPVKDVDKFYLAWHLFGMSSLFNIAIGLLQITGAVLLVINRTLIVGALVLLPVIFSIFLIDLAFTGNAFGSALTVRLGMMVLCDLLVLFHYKDRLIQAYKILTAHPVFRLQVRWYFYLLLPLLGLGMDFIIAILTLPFKMLIDWFIK